MEFLLELRWSLLAGQTPSACLPCHCPAVLSLLISALGFLIPSWVNALVPQAFGWGHALHQSQLAPRVIQRRWQERRKLVLPNAARQRPLLPPRSLFFLYLLFLSENDMANSSEGNEDDPLVEESEAKLLRWIQGIRIPQCETVEELRVFANGSAFPTLAAAAFAQGPQEDISLEEEEDDHDDWRNHSERTRRCTPM